MKHYQNLLKNGQSLPYFQLTTVPFYFDLERSLKINENRGNLAQYKSRKKVVFYLLHIYKQIQIFQSLVSHFS